MQSQPLNFQRIRFEEYSSEEVLFFVRNNGIKSFFDQYYPESFLKLFKSITEFKTISEYYYEDSIYIDLRAYRYIDLNISDKEQLVGTLPLIEIIMRCRALREISFVEARQLIYICGKYFLELFSSKKIKLVVCGTVDNYVMDVMVRIGRSIGVMFIGVTHSFLTPSYILVTLYGEQNVVRKSIEIDEIETIYAKISNRVPSKLAISKVRSQKNAVRVTISYIYRYFARYIINYKIFGKLNYEYRFAPYFGGLDLVKNFIFSKKFSTLEQCFQPGDINNESKVYIPMHYYPEATLDYWTDEIDCADYSNSLINVIKFFERIDVEVILKEHPASYMIRPNSFYGMLAKFKNVKILNPFVSTYDVFDRIKYVVVWNGSTGVEAILRDKFVSFVCRNYYNSTCYVHYNNFRSARKMNSFEKRKIIESVLLTSWKV